MAVNLESLPAEEPTVTALKGATIPDDAALQGANQILISTGTGIKTFPLRALGGKRNDEAADTIGSFITLTGRRV